MLSTNQATTLFVLLLPPLRGVVAKALGMDAHEAKFKQFLKDRNDLSKQQQQQQSAGGGASGGGGGGGSGGGSGGDELDAFVWLKGVVRAAKEAMASEVLPGRRRLGSTDDEGEYNEERDLLKNILEPALRVAGPLLWRTYGAPFASLLREIQLDVRHTTEKETPPRPE